MERNCTWLADLRCCRPVTRKKARLSWRPSLSDPVVWAVRRLAFRERKRKAPAFGAQGWGLWGWGNWKQGRLPGSVQQDRVNKPQSPNIKLRVS
jgi:hypothetical protein